MSPQSNYPLRTLAEITASMPEKDEAAVSLVTKAYAFAEEAHREQKRYSGHSYFTHLAEVGWLLGGMGMDARTVAAGLLHDVIEDARVSREDIEREFGIEVRALVEGVTKLGTVRYRGLDRHAESLRKFFAATATDLRVLIIKLVDRLHNVRTLAHVPESKRKRIALETLEIYAPIADRLGMSIMKTDLEDASFPFAYPESYEKTRELLKERKSENEKRLEKTEKALKRELAQAGIRNFRTEARIKGVYSLFKKLERKNWDIMKIYDILALRIILPTVSECYSALGVVHAQWRPVPGKIKDYIAFPKPNGYKSIHTTVYTGDGGALEIQIRTEDMHQEALYGIASHLSYKELQNSQSRGRGLEWIRQFLPGARTPRQTADKMKSSKKAAAPDAGVPQWVKDLAHVHQAGEETKDDYLDTLKADFFSHRVFVFTPHNDVIDLPLHATPIDFAYAIHSDIGNHMAGARVNGKMVTLDTPLHNGDMVEIITKPSAHPTAKWYDMARTNLAKKHIRAAVGSAHKGALRTPKP